MDHAAKKSPDSVPPFGGLTRVVVGEEYPPGAYFGRNKTNFGYETAEGGMGHWTFGTTLELFAVRDTIRFTHATGPIWFRAADLPSDPQTRPPEDICVKSGETVNPGHLYMHQNRFAHEIEIFALEDEYNQITVVALGRFDYHTVVVPMTLHCGFHGLLKWRPIE